MYVNAPGDPRGPGRGSAWLRTDPGGLRTPAAGPTSQVDTHAIPTGRHPEEAEPAASRMTREADSGGPDVARVLVVDHGGDLPPEAGAQLRSAGFDVVETQSLRDTEALLAEGGPLAAAPPAVIVLNPLAPVAGGVEFQLVEGLQRAGAPIPVLVLVQDAEELAEAKRLQVQLHDFAFKPCSADELVHRVELALRMRERFSRLHQRAEELANEITIDFKTELLSERHFRSLLQREFKLAQRHHLPLSLLLVDVDDFKTVNDTTEYAFGDRVLQAVARALKDGVRETDFAARFGGDEFALLLPHTTPAEAVHTAMRIRKTIAGMAVESEHYKHQVTVSIGIDTYDGRSTTSPEELRRNANKALQEAKHRGKDQVWLYSERTGGTEQSTQ